MNRDEESVASARSLELKAIGALFCIAHNGIKGDAPQEGKVLWGVILTDAGRVFAQIDMEKSM